MGTALDRSAAPASVGKRPTPTGWPGLRVALTGITGSLGEPLAARLAEEEQIESVVGLSRRPLPSSLRENPKIRHVQADILSSQAKTLLDGVDVLIHSAFQAYGRNINELRRTNVEGSIQICRLALNAGVKRIVFISSAAAYGAHADNPVPLPDDAPLRPNPESWYSVHKAEVESWLDGLAETLPDTAVLRVRPVMVLGPRADLGAEAMRRLYRYLVPAFRHNNQLYQFIHIDDAVDAITKATLIGLTGPINLAGPGWLSPAQMANETGGRLVWLPGFIDRLAPLIHRLHLSPVGQERSVLARYPLVLGCKRVSEELGLQPRTTVQTLREFMS